MNHKQPCLTTIKLFFWSRVILCNCRKYYRKKITVNFRTPRRCVLHFSCLYIKTVIARRIYVAENQKLSWNVLFTVLCIYFISICNVFKFLFFFRCLRCNAKEVLRIFFYYNVLVYTLIICIVDIKCWHWRSSVF